jgi:hypothetical protein
MRSITTPRVCRVRLVNHVTGFATVLESRREQYPLLFDLAQLVRCLNLSSVSLLKASLHLFPDSILLQLHTNRQLSDLAKQQEVVDQVNREMLTYIETLLAWEGGPQT